MYVPRSAIAGFFRSTTFYTFVVLLYTTVGVRSVADIRFDFSRCVQAVQQVHAVEIFDFRRHNIERVTETNGAQFETASKPTRADYITWTRAVAASAV